MRTGKLSVLRLKQQYKYYNYKYNLSVDDNDVLGDRYFWRDRDSTLSDRLLVGNFIVMDEQDQVIFDEDEWVLIKCTNKSSGNVVFAFYSDKQELPSAVVDYFTQYAAIMEF